MVLNILLRSDLVNSISLKLYTIVIRVSSSDTSVFCLVSLSASNYIFLSPCQTPFLSPSPSVCIQLQISLFLSLSKYEPNPCLCLCLYPFPFLSLDVHTFLTHRPLYCIWLQMFSFISLSYPATVWLSLPSPSLSFAVCLYLSQWTGWFLWGLHPDTVTGVSLFLRWWRHFAVRITTPDIDGEETQDFRGHREQVGGGSFKATHTPVVGTGAHCSLRLTQSIKGKPLFIISLLHLATLYISVLL